MKHTYLYPIADSEVWLWGAARMGASDAFGSPRFDASEEEFLLSVNLGDAMGGARELLMKRLETRDRVCIGRSYVIPGSLDDVAQERSREADRTVREVTGMMWDAPRLGGHLYANLFAMLRGTAGMDGRDDWEKVRQFLTDHRCTKENGKKTRVIPVWM